MKKIIKFIYSALLFMFIFSITLINVKAESNSNYISLDSENLWMLTDYFEEAPLTVEATIKLPSGFTDRGGVIFSNYGNKISKAYITYEIYTNGNPSITMVDLNGNKISGLYKNVNVATGEWVHLSFVISGNECSCYVDGQLKETKTFNAPYESHIPVHKFGVGGDARTDNSQNFKGEIADIAIYGDARTAIEVASDYAATEIDKSDLIVAYDLSITNTTDIIKDLSDNNNDLRKQYEYDPNFSDPEPADYDYSFAVIGDTQSLVPSYANLKLGGIQNQGATIEWEGKTYTPVSYHLHYL